VADIEELGDTIVETIQETKETLNWE
jgi:hypothetical protein